MTASANNMADALRAILLQVVQGKVLERDACITQARTALRDYEAERDGPAHLDPHGPVPIVGKRANVYDWEAGINEDDPADFYVVRNDPAPSIDRAIIAWCDTEQDAELIANALNKENA